MKYNYGSAFAVPASGNTSLPDVDSSRFAGRTSGMRKVRLRPLGPPRRTAFLLTSWGPEGPSFPLEGRLEDDLGLLAVLGAILRPVWALMAVLGLSWPSFGALLGRLGLVWGASWAVVTAGGGWGRDDGPEPCTLAPSWLPLGPPLGALLGPSWAPRGPFLGLLLASRGALDPSRGGVRKRMPHSASSEALSGPLGVESRGHGGSEKWTNSYENYMCLLYTFVHSRFRALESRGRFKRGPLGPSRGPSWGLLGVSWGLLGP